MTSPGIRLSFVEENDVRQWNGDTWDFLALEYSASNPVDWWDPMAVNHGDSGILGYCDGHAERHKWRDPWTKGRMEYFVEKGLTTYGSLPRTPPEQRTDVEYIYQGWAYRHKK